jgi:bifunctional UDP-N-acetylglucosamine pyrophosphorylase/glucosamine-1-phosphate N-acetyltransferase
LIEDSEIGNNCTILYSVIANSRLGNNIRIGPYAHLRQQVQVGDNCRIGNFVELKKTTLGIGSNVAHLSYLGDTITGQQVNIGAGTITANYDGISKHQTVIGDRSKTGSNSVLVAPVNIGADVTIAAGSTVTDDVMSGALAIARARQVVKPDWKLGKTTE